MKTVKTDLDFVRVGASFFSLRSSESIDYAVMENTEDAVMVPLNADWNDMGSWSSVWQTSDKCELGNVAIGDTLLLETNNSYARSNAKLIATRGVSDLEIKYTEDSVLVAGKDCSLGIKNYCRVTQGGVP